VIDVHAHFVPEVYRAALVEHGHGHPDGFPGIPPWSAESHLALMDQLGITTSLLSISSPGVCLGGTSDATELARQVNEEGRRVVVDHPGRFGLLASLPLPDVDATLAEIAHCEDRLEVDGFAVLTRAGATSLGDDALVPVFAELDRRRARLFVHPTSPPCWEQVSRGRPRPMLEFLFETTRTVVDLILKGTVAAYPGIEVIVPHGGATLPMVADRVAAFARVLDTHPGADVLRDLNRLHYDLAGFPLPRQLDALLTLARPGHLHYGSDFPFTPEPAVTGGHDGLSGVELDGRRLLDVLRDNSDRLFPSSEARQGSGQTG
jgi:6-methylsalicylate decarboxylase